MTHPDPGSAAHLSESAIFGQPRQASSTEREDHAGMRRVLSRSFSARRLASLRPRVQQLVDDLLDELARRTPPVDFHEAISFPPLPCFAPRRTRREPPSPPHRGVSRNYPSPGELPP